MDEIRQELTTVMKKQYPKKSPTNENLNEFYLQRVRKNLHIVLCFSPVSTTQTHMSNIKSKSIQQKIFYKEFRLCIQHLNQQ
jgi:hypothetical protein